MRIEAFQNEHERSTVNLLSKKHSRKGASLLEFGLLAGLISLTSIAAVIGVGDKVARGFCESAVALGYDGDCGAEGQKNSAPDADPKVSPSVANFQHTPNSRIATITLNAGDYSDEICTIEGQTSGEWNSIWTGACGDSVNIALDEAVLPGASGPWSNIALRLITPASAKPEDGISVGSLTCNAVEGAASATPNIDEDCDRNFDNKMYGPDRRSASYSEVQRDGMWVANFGNNRTALCKFTLGPEAEAVVTNTIGQIFGNYVYDLTYPSGSYTTRYANNRADIIMSLTCRTKLYY
jgi:Flp pilus assembly pilin Flp